MSNRHIIDSHDLVMFTLAEHHCALPLTLVERVVRAVAVTPLPQAPAIVLGVINAGGQVAPVVDTRQRLGLIAAELGLDDRLLLARTPRRLLALLADSVEGVRRVEDDQVQAATQGLAFAPYLQGVAKLPDGLVLIYDLEAFLSLEEERQLAAALGEGRP